MTKTRVEADSMGEFNVPAEVLYGATTARAVENFPISGRPFPPEFIKMFGELKLACAKANEKLGKLDKNLSKSIEQAAKRVAAGECCEHFPIDVFQTGSGTSTNMNTNEVIANLANLAAGNGLGEKSPVHPNDHVNMGQSSNDTMPTVIHLSAAKQIKEDLLPALHALQAAFAKKADEFADVIKIGRTHLMDATPITLGQEFSGFASQLAQGIQGLEKVQAPLNELAIGGTAVGTGINTHPKFAQEVCKVLQERTDLPVVEASNHFAAQGAKDACVAASGALKTIAGSLLKIADDIRWLGSGPRAGLAEIVLPELQPGSSIMPGKVNPVMPEVVSQVAVQVIANDSAITWGSSLGRLDLNVFMPLIAVNLLDSIKLLASAAKVFDEKCVSGIAANRERCEELVERSLMLATALAPHIGYDKAAALAKRAHVENKTIRELAIAEKILSEAELNKVLDMRAMLSPKA